MPIELRERTRSAPKEVMPMKCLRRSLLLGFAAVIFPTVVLADRAEDTAFEKMGRGLAGMTTSFLELPGNIAATSREDGPGAAATLGFAKGIGMIPVRTLVGVYEFVTAPIPVPDGYRPIIEPEYPWDYFEDGEGPARMSRR
jgi:putative exosortase-associated protein (TIGR04073 family)